MNILKEQNKGLQHKLNVKTLLYENVQKQSISHIQELNDIKIKYENL